MVKKVKKAKKAVKVKKTAKVTKAVKEKKAPKEKIIGKVEDFFAKVGVVAVKLKAPLKAGDTIHIKGHTTDFTQIVESMQLDHQPIQSAKKGDDIGIQVKEKVRKTDTIYKV